MSGQVVPLRCYRAEHLRSRDPEPARWVQTLCPLLTHGGMNMGKLSSQCLDFLTREVGIIITQYHRVVVMESWVNLHKSP